MFINPGLEFIETIGIPETLDDVLKYARFLRDQARLPSEPPIELKLIFQHFGIDAPKRAKLPGQQGLLLNPDSGLIIINETDPLVRQRFTEAHELMELLFSVIPTGRGWAARNPGGLSHVIKEQWCDAGAAELLLPVDFVRQRVDLSGATFATARLIAADFRVSLTASLRQMINTSARAQAVVVWNMKNKPSEVHAQHINELQGSLFSNLVDESSYPPRLRVEWHVSNQRNMYIPAYKSIDENSIAFEAWQSNMFMKGNDVLHLGQKSLRFHGEHQPIMHNAERRLLSLLTFA